MSVRSRADAWPRRRVVPSRGLVFLTAAGYVAMAVDESHRLLELAMPRPTAEDAADSLGIGRLSPAPQPDPCDPLVESLRRYFDGEPVRFDWPLNLSGLTEFQRLALQCCAEIPYGQTRSYGWIADRMGRPKSARPVGGAMGANPIPILIPCHRVVGCDGSLVGFGAGMEWKIRLLGLEGVTGGAG